MSITAFNQLMAIAPSILNINPFEHYDYAFEKISEKFHIVRLENLLFTEIDDNDQLIYAINNIYPLLDLPISSNRSTI
jgi:hypothetical protein